MSADRATVTGTLGPIDREGLVDFAQRLVRTPSSSTHEGDVASLVAEEMRLLGFDEVLVDPMGNAIGRIGPGKGPRLLYDAHMDTVGVADPDRWRRDPFAGEIEKGVLYGLGACDMKGALAAMVYACKALRDSPVELSGDLYVACIVQEEPCEGMAIRYVIAESGIRPDWVLLGEATDLQVSRGQRGRMEMEVNVRGRACHSSAPERGTNAIYEATRIIMGVELLAPQLSNDSFLGPGTIAVTDIHSTSGSRNALPDKCTLCLDRRLTVGETETRALGEIRRILMREGVQASVVVPTYESVSYTGLPTRARQVFPYWVTAEDTPLARTLIETIEDDLGVSPRVGRWGFSTDGVYTAGVAGIPTIGFGPGEERHAHTVDDQVRLADLVAATRVYASFASRMLA